MIPEERPDPKVWRFPRYPNTAPQTWFHRRYLILCEPVQRIGFEFAAAQRYFSPEPSSTAGTAQASCSVPSWAPIGNETEIMGFDSTSEPRFSSAIDPPKHLTGPLRS